MKINREYRNIKTIKDEFDDFIVEGYASTFEQEYLINVIDDTQIYEIISSSAFDECDMSDVILQYNHEGKVFARNKNDTLKVSIDDKGLYIQADLSKSVEARNLFEEIKNGLLDKMSFGFIVDSDDIYFQNDKLYRRINKIKKLYDVSVVNEPANDNTYINKRCYNGVINNDVTERLQKSLYDIKKTKLMLNILKEKEKFSG